MSAAQTTATARFAFASGTLVHVLGPYQMDLGGRTTTIEYRCTQAAG